MSKNKWRGNKNSIPRPEELTDKQADRLNAAFRLVCFIKGGKSAAAALKHLSGEFPDLPKSERWAQKIYAAYEQGGIETLFDKREVNKRPEIFTAEQKHKVLAIWHARPVAGFKAIWREAKRSFEGKGIPFPEYDVVRKFLKGQSEQDKLARAGKINIWDKQGRPVVVINNTKDSNERWQIDHSRLDIWVRVFINGEWVIREVWITVVLDVHSRSVAGFILSTKYPDAWTNSLLLRQAILPKKNPKWRNKGIPKILQPDCGKDFLSKAVAATLAYLDIIIAPDPPYYPNAKGKIERFFRTLDEGCLRLQSGHMAATTKRAEVAKRYLPVLLTRRQLMREIETWIVEEYHQTIHSTTKRKPAEMWEETVKLRLPASEEALDSLLLKSDAVRKVQHTGVRFYVLGKGDKENRGGHYWAPELTYYWKREVQIRYNPESLESVLLYCAATGEYICEAWLMGGENAKYGIEHIKTHRNQFRRGLIERHKDYAEEILELDRRKVREEDWNLAREKADELAAQSAEAVILQGDDDDVDLILDLLEAGDMED